MATVFVHIIAAFFVTYGIAFSLVPEFMLGLVIGANETSSTGLIDVRATYGGMSIAVGLILHWMALQVDLVKQALQFIMVLMLAMAIPRSIGIILDGEANWVMYLYLMLEITVITIAFFCSKKQILKKLLASK